LPSLGRRALVGVLLLGFLLALTVGVPSYVLGVLGDHGGSTPLSGLELTVGGVAVSGLVAVAYVLRPTRAYGPIVTVRAAVTIAYFLSLASVASVAFALGGGVTATVDFGAVLRWLALVPVFGVLGGALVSASDVRDLYARLRQEFPA
jgi:hypothetical protein